MKEYLIQRYAVGNWSAVRGHVPFFATGPAFYQHTVARSLERFGEHRFTSGLVSALRTEMGGLQTDWRDVVAEWLLRSHIVQALWSVDGGECLPEEARWAMSIAGLAEQIPPGDVAEETLYLLSGLSDPSHYRSYVAEDGLELVPCPVP